MELCEYEGSPSSELSDQQNCTGRQTSRLNVSDTHIEKAMNRPHCRDRAHTALMVTFTVAAIALGASQVFLFTQMRQLQGSVSALNSLSKSRGNVITSLTDQQLSVLDCPIDLVREIQGQILTISANLTSLDVRTDTLIRNLTTETIKTSLLQELLQDTSATVIHQVETFANDINMLNCSIYHQLLPNLVTTVYFNKTLQSLDQQAQTYKASILDHINVTVAHLNLDQLSTTISDQVVTLAHMLWNQTDAENLELKSNLTSLSTQQQQCLVDLTAQLKVVSNSLQIINTTFAGELESLRDNFTNFQQFTSLQIEAFKSNQSEQNIMHRELNTTICDTITQLASEIEVVKNQAYLHKTGMENMNWTFSQAIRNLTAIHSDIDHTSEQKCESVYHNLSDEVKNLSLSINAAEGRWMALSQDLMLKIDNHSLFDQVTNNSQRATEILKLIGTTTRDLSEDFNTQLDTLNNSFHSQQTSVVDDLIVFRNLSHNSIMSAESKIQDMFQKLSAEIYIQGNSSESTLFNLMKISETMKTQMTKDLAEIRLKIEANNATIYEIGQAFDTSTETMNHTTILLNLFMMDASMSVSELRDTILYLASIHGSEVVSVVEFISRIDQQTCSTCSPVTPCLTSRTEPISNCEVGYIQTENYPNNYRDHIDHTLVIDLPNSSINTLEVLLLSFELEDSNDCRFDYLEIQGQKYCGRKTNHPLTFDVTGETSINMKFVTDGYKNFPGFKLVFQFS